MKRTFVLVACFAWIPVRLAAGEPVDYLRDVKPILQSRCYACHGALKQKSKLRLDTAALIRKGGRDGPAIEPGNIDKSLLIQRVSAPEPSERMPPEGKPLTVEQITLLKAWVRQGARAPAGEKPQADPRQHWAFQRPIRPPVPHVAGAAWVRNPIDAFVAAGHEQRGLAPLPPADRAVLLRRVYLDLTGLPPTRDELQAFLTDRSDDAYEKVVDRLLAGPRYAERWARHWMDVWRYSDWYGSRYINELRNSRRHIWRWRDWIIDSLDRDKGYDRMILEMLAGDELAPGDAGVQRASGYLGRNFYVFNRNVWLQDTVEYTGMAFLGVTFKCCRCHDHKYDPIAQEEYYRFRACFESHQVRTDAIPGKPELLKANLAMGSPPGSNLKDGFDCVYDADPAAVTYLFERGNDKNPVKDRPIQPGVPRVLGGDFRIEPVKLPLEAFYPSLRLAMCQAMIADAKTAIAKASAERDKASRGRHPPEARQTLAGRQAGASAPVPLPLQVAEQEVAARQAQLASLEARIVAERAKYAQPPDPALPRLALAAVKAERAAALSQAEWDVAQAELELATARTALKPKDDKSIKAVAAAEKKLADLRARHATAQTAAAQTSPTYTPLGPVYPRTSSGRRLALARWIAARDNPLTARVAVNHIWLRHMGSALVPSVANFGLNGKRPTHPELLDWLAVEFMDSGWSMKHLHRLIVTSNTYRMATGSDHLQPVAVGSPDPLKRVTTNSARSDRLQAVGGQSPDPLKRVTTNRMTDPENRFLWRANVRRMEAEAVRDSILHLAGRLDPVRGGEDLDPTTDAVSTRRSLYFRHTPDEKPLILDVFDGANPAECFERTESIMPQQALALANSDFSHSQARLIARRVERPGMPDSDFITAAFEHVLTRPPLPDEHARCQDFVYRETQLFAQGRLLVPISAVGGPSAVPPAPDPHERAREDLVHVLLNYNEFVTIR